MAYPTSPSSQNLTSFGNPTSSPFQINDKYYQFVDNFSWVLGKHSLRFGGEYRYNEFPQLGNEFPRGQFYFNSQYTNMVTPTGGGTGGYTGADFLLGDTYDAIVAVALAQANFRNSEWAAYIDDTWRIRPHLTLSLGFRWEVAQPLLDGAGLEPNVQLQQPLPNQANVPDLSSASGLRPHGQAGIFTTASTSATTPYWAANGGIAGSPPLQTVRDGRMGSRLINTNYHDFAPRIGIAYSPSDKWSIRAGYRHLLLDGEQELHLRSRSRNGWPGHDPGAYHLGAADVHLHEFPQHVSASSDHTGRPHLGREPNTCRTAPAMQYVLNVQRTLGNSTTLEVGYTGSVKPPPGLPAG